MYTHHNATDKCVQPILLPNNQLNGLHSERGLSTGIYAGRLCNNSERSEKLARESERSRLKIKPPLSPNASKNKNSEGRKGRPNTTYRSSSVGSTSDTRNSPDIRHFLGSDTMEITNNISPRKISDNDTQPLKPTATDKQSLQSPSRDNSQFYVGSDKDQEPMINNPQAPTIVSNSIKDPLATDPHSTTMASKNDIEQLRKDEEEIAKIQKRIDEAEATSMEKLLLEMQLDTKRENLKTRKMMQSMIQQVSHVKEVNKTLSGKVTQLSTDQIKSEKSTGDLAKELTTVRKEVSILTGIVHKQSMVIQHLQDYNSTYENNKFRNDIVIQGLDPDTNDNDQHLKEMVNDFFSQTTKIRRNIALQSVVRLGNKRSPTLSVTLKNVRDKGAIFRCVKNIKGIKNSQDENYYVNDRLTFEQQEIQKRYKAIKKANSDLPATDRHNLTFKKGKLLVNEVPYEKAIVHPDMQSTVSPSNQTAIDNLYQTESETFKNGKCKFLAISQEVRCLNDVQLGYIKARQKHPGALHIVCTYHIPGPGIAHNSDFVDNKEHGAGRAIHKLMTDSNITYRAIYAIRYYGGSHLGPSRFDSYREATTSAIARSSYNSVVKRNQFLFNSQKAGLPLNTPTVQQPGSSASTCNTPIPQQEGAIAVLSPACSLTLAAFQKTNVWGSTANSWEETVSSCRERTNSFPSLSSTIKAAAYRATTRNRP